MFLGADKLRKVGENESSRDRFRSKNRINLNDLLRKRVEEKKVDKKTNLIILSSASALAVVVLLILNL